jgi:hypothetical protein
MLGQTDLQREAAATGFRPEALEKVIHLIWDCWKDSPVILF